MGGFYRFYPQVGTRRTTYERASYSNEPPPVDSCPATAYLDRWGDAVMTGWAAWAIPPEPTFATIRDLIDSWDVNWPLANSNFSKAAPVAAVIVAGEVQACADGSYMVNLCNKLAMAAWLLEHKADW